MQPSPELKIGDIVQIDPAHDVDGCGGCLLTVSEVKAWGVYGFVESPESRTHCRVEYRHVEPTGGRARWITKAMAADMGERA